MSGSRERCSDSSVGRSRERSPLRPLQRARSDLAAADGSTGSPAAVNHRGISIHLETAKHPPEVSNRRPQAPGSPAPVELAGKDLAQHQSISSVQAGILSGAAVDRSMAKLT